jgi:hypothetical protein
MDYLSTSSNEDSVLRDSICGKCPTLARGTSGLTNGRSGREGQMIVAILIAASLVVATLFLLIVLIIAIVRLPVLMIVEYRRGRTIKERLDAIELTGIKKAR